MKLLKVLKQEMSVLLLVALIVSSVFSGCAIFKENQVVLHPIEKSDIYTIPAGAEINIPAGTVIKEKIDGKEVTTASWEKDTKLINEKNGYFISDYYFKEVAEVKMETKK